MPQILTIDGAVVWQLHVEPEGDPRMTKKNAPGVPTPPGPGTKKPKCPADELPATGGDHDGDASLGSATAFEATEQTRDDEDSDEDNDDLALTHGR